MSLQQQMMRVETTGEDRHSNGAENFDNNDDSIDNDNDDDNDNKGDDDDNKNENNTRNLNGNATMTKKAKIAEPRWFLLAEGVIPPKKWLMLK